jgi:hypothetical protein
MSLNPFVAEFVDARRRELLAGADAHRLFKAASVRANRLRARRHALVSRRRSQWWWSWRPPDDPAPGARTCLGNQ